jgi:NAD(P)-dependent dehydrogenase (short-subunit alcohol dehydrogenase family)
MSHDTAIMLKRPLISQSNSCIDPLRPRISLNFRQRAELRYGLGQPDDIAGIAVFLAFDAAAWVTGERLTTSGGYY